jgi:hypothetical protein
VSLDNADDLIHGIFGDWPGRSWFNSPGIPRQPSVFPVLFVLDANTPNLVGADDATDDLRTTQYRSILSVVGYSNEETLGQTRVPFTCGVAGTQLASTLGGLPLAGKQLAVNWTCLFCHRFRWNEVRSAAQRAAFCHPTSGQGDLRFDTGG